jgi:hypothetical protein
METLVFDCTRLFSKAWHPILCATNMREQARRGIGRLLPD